MLHLRSEKLNPSSQDYLRQKQQDIDGQADFPTKVRRAQSLWDNKSSGIPGKNAFRDIREKLSMMSSSPGICCYCENNESTDIEHIYPKKSYPNKAFQWENYLLACSVCNTHYKSDKCSVFDPEQSHAVSDITPPRGRFPEPPNEDYCLVNPRFENPMDFFKLELTRTQSFFFEPLTLNAQSRSFLKANYTIETLGLNTRDTVVNARKAAAQDFIAALRKYQQVHQAGTFDELEAVVADIPTVDRNQSLEQEKDRIKAAIRDYIKTRSHPTVWQELKRQRSDLPVTNSLFSAFPEALDW